MAVKLYVWRSTALQQCALGHIIAAGVDITEAKSRAMREFERSVIEGRYYYLDDRDRYELRQKFLADLRTEPTITETVCVIWDRSEL